ncbi:MAG: GNAT family N-acetyltransferase [Gammaproteobacteria bacterium]|nr:GNAT family N-acetyltransferase [Gammaproteobacteria bacterium]MDH4254251.1 GNAT family N-acetyltransferase [Gammaproteobacteria bacterium]MDH5311025.1 GNAT family N-acetyltransferase [Gammaproteobacteria bacterium]
MANKKRVDIPENLGRPSEIDYSSAAMDFGPLDRDRVPIRTMTEGDLMAIVAIDRRITGRDRAGYLGQKLDEALNQTDIRVSLVADIDGTAAGFIMARVDLGEFGRLEPAAVLDTLGVDPGFRDRGVGRALMSQLFANLSSLRIDKVLTEVDWKERGLIAFLAECDFRPSTRLAFEYRPR